METAPPRKGAPATAARTRRAALTRLRASTPGRVLSAYGSTHSGSHAAGLAFNAVMAMFPMILGALAIIGLVVNGAGIQSQAQTAILRAFPGTSGVELNTVVTHDLHHYAGLLGIAGILGLLWGVTNFFGSLEFCLSRIFEFPQRSFLRQRAMGAVMMFVLVAALLVAVGSNTLMTLVPVMAGIGPAAGVLRRGGPHPDHLPAGAQPDLPHPPALARGGDLGRADRADHPPLPPLRQARPRFRHLWPELGSLLPARHLALLPLPIHPPRGPLEPGASRRGVHGVAPSGHRG